MGQSTTDQERLPAIDPAGIDPIDGDVADGRTRRRARNRGHVLDAVLSLIREGDHAPSIASIAARAGVSLRSVFRYFADVDDLVSAAIQHGVREAIPLSEILGVGEGPLEMRIDTFVDSRLRVYDATHGFGRVARNRSDSIPALADAIAQVHLLLRSQARAQFEPELSRLDSADAELILDAVTVLTGFGAFDAERSVFGHSLVRIGTVWKSALAAQLVEV